MPLTPKNCLPSPPSNPCDLPDRVSAPIAWSPLYSQQHHSHRRAMGFPYIFPPTHRCRHPWPGVRSEAGPRSYRRPPCVKTQPRKPPSPVSRHPLPSRNRRSSHLQQTLHKHPLATRHSLLERSEPLRRITPAPEPSSRRSQHGGATCRPRAARRAVAPRGFRPPRRPYAPRQAVRAAGCIRRLGNRAAAEGRGRVHASTRRRRCWLNCRGYRRFYGRCCRSGP